jgi:hypothetical protein
MKLSKRTSIQKLDKTSNVKKLSTVSKNWIVPAKRESVTNKKNIDPEYLRTQYKGTILRTSKAHEQGKLFWGTTTTYEAQGTVIHPQEFEQEQRKVRNTREPSSLAIKKYRPTSYNNQVPGWLIVHKWCPNVFYPQEGTSILKKRRVPLDKRSLCITRSTTGNNNNVIPWTTGRKPTRHFQAKQVSNLFSDDEE